MQFAVCRFADLPQPRVCQIATPKIGRAFLKAFRCYIEGFEPAMLAGSLSEVVNRCKIKKYISKDISLASASVAQRLTRCHLIEVALVQNHCLSENSLI